MNSKKYKSLRLGKFKFAITPSKSFFSFAGFLSSKNDSFPWYIEKFKERVVNRFGEGKISILGLGMGIGMISHLGLNADIEYVENDEKMIEFAKKEFNLPKDTKIQKMDAGKFLKNKNSKKYDVVFYDIFDRNEFEPKFLDSYFIRKIKELLTKNGVLIINLVDYKKNTWKWAGKFPCAKIFLRRKLGFGLKMNYILEIEKRKLM